MKKTRQPHVIDKNKRSFLKLFGAVSISLLGWSVLPSRAEAAGGRVAPVAGLKNVGNIRKSPVTDDTLTSVKSQTDKFTFNNSNSLYVQSASSLHSQVENIANVTVNPATKGTLDAVQTQTNKLTFAQGTDLWTTGSTPALDASVNVKDITQNNVNPAKVETIQLWAHLLKQMESRGTVGADTIRKVSVDTYTSNVITGNGVMTGTEPSITVANDSVVTVNTITAGTTYNGWNRGMFIDVARDAYARSIRKRIAFS